MIPKLKVPDTFNSATFNSAKTFLDANIVITAFGGFPPHRLAAMAVLQDAGRALLATATLMGQPNLLYSLETPALIGLQPDPVYHEYFTV